jgi:hypothetical protein
MRDVSFTGHHLEEVMIGSTKHKVDAGTSQVYI